MKMSSMVGVCSAVALCLAAGTAQAGPNPGAPKNVKHSHKAKVTKAQRRPVVAPSGTALPLMPAKVASIHKLANGKVQLTSPWMPYNGAGNDTQDTLVYDAAQVDPASGVPYGGAECNVPDGNRWLLNYNDDGTKFENPNSLSYMEIDSKFNGAQSGRATFLYYWTSTGANFYIAFFTCEDFSLDCSDPTGDNFYDGIIYGFYDAPSAFYYTDADTEADGLFYTMPADGKGGYQMVFADTVDGDGTIHLTPGKAQPGLWGTSNNGGIPGRPGISMDPTYDDIGDDGRTADGVLDGATECYSYAYGVCPDPLSKAASFWTSGEGNPGCYPDCNLDGKLDLFDFLCFVNGFNSGDAYSDCNGDKAHDLFDFLCFVNAFNTGC